MTNVQKTKIFMFLILLTVYRSAKEYDSSDTKETVFEIKHLGKYRISHLSDKAKLTFDVYGLNNKNDPDDVRNQGYLFSIENKPLQFAPYSKSGYSLIDINLKKSQSLSVSFKNKTDSDSKKNIEVKNIKVTNESASKDDEDKVDEQKNEEDKQSDEEEITNEDEEGNKIFFKNMVVYMGKVTIDSYVQILNGNGECLGFSEKSNRYKFVDCEKTYDSTTFKMVRIASKEEIQRARYIRERAKHDILPPEQLSEIIKLNNKLKPVFDELLLSDIDRATKLAGILNEDKRIGQPVLGLLIYNVEHEKAAEDKQNEEDNKGILSDLNTSPNNHTKSKDPFKTTVENKPIDVEYEPNDFEYLVKTLNDTVQKKNLEAEKQKLKEEKKNLEEEKKNLEEELKRIKEATTGREIKEKSETIDKRNKTITNKEQEIDKLRKMIETSKEKEFRTQIKQLKNQLETKEEELKNKKGEEEKLKENLKNKEEEFKKELKNNEGEFNNYTGREKKPIINLSGSNITNKSSSKPGRNPLGAIFG